MDSHLIAGAYSQQFRQNDEISLDSDRVEAINKAKRLSQETNRRRKLQANKRQLQAKREEQRRHDILTRRREEQRQATEKYQRYHLPPSARQHYRPASRTFGGTTLDTALQLIRGGILHHNRPMSSHERFLSLAEENVDLLESSFNKLRPHSTRPGSGRLAHQLDAKERAELMNYSKQNWTASKSLFEQQLEQQQSFLLEQKQSLQEFNNAVNNEIFGRKAFGATGPQNDNNNDAVEKGEDAYLSDSCCSVDSLDDRTSADLNNDTFNKTKLVTSQSRHTTVYIYHDAENDRKVNNECMSLPQQQQKQELAKQNLDPKLEQQQQQQHVTPLALSREPKDENNLQHENVDLFTLSHKNGSLLDGAKNETGPIPNLSAYINQNQSIPNAAETSYNNAVGSNKMKNGDHKMEKYQPSLKQFSSDSLDSGSSSSIKSVLTLQGINKETSKASDNIYLQGAGNRSNFSTSNINNNRISGTAGISPRTYKLLHSENNNLSGQTASPNIKQSQVAWVSPSQVETNSASGNENKRNDEQFQPHYASDISKWPGTSSQGQISMSVVNTNIHLYNSGGTLPVTMPASSPATLPSRFVPNSSIYTLAGSKLDAADTARTNSDQPSKDLPSAAAVNLNMNNDATYLNIMNSTYPQTDSQDYRNTISKQVQMFNYLSQTDVSSTGILQTDIREQSATDKLMSKQSSAFQNGSAAGSPGVHSLTHQNTQNYYKQWINDNALTGAVPSYTGRSHLPVSRPPSPVSSTANVTAQSHASAVQTGSQPVSFVRETEIIRKTNTRSNNNTLCDVAKERKEENLLVDEDSEDMRPLRGILKQTHARNIPHHQEKAPTGKPPVRDSLELAHLHNDKKSKKKSVRFASHHDQDDGDENIEDRNTDKQTDINTGLSTYNTSFNRPLSAKTMSASNSEKNMRVQRALSADSYRQQPVMSEHLQIRNVQQMSSGSVPVNSSEVTNSAYTNTLQERSSLPPSLVNPLNTTPIHRPKAAAHIIMSTDTKNEASKGHNDNYTGPASAYRSHTEAKIKPVNNNFMSKVPVKIPANRESNIVVYNAAYTPHTEGVPSGYTNKTGANVAAEESVFQVSKELPQQQTFDKPRNVYSNSKHVSFSNLSATASVLPASKKVPNPQSNGGTASFSTSSNNVVYDKSGIRVDRTPTDEEITWLWDKVRNCLSREGGNKSSPSANGNSDPGSRQTPTFSTKLIDGAALGLGTHNSASDGTTNVKSGPGVFQPQNVPVANPQNGIKAVLQPQGSYLRRYSLLKQRRANSASAIRNNTGAEGQRANGAVYGRNSTIPLQQTSSVAGQHQQQDKPTPMMFGYKPQDEVSESTAAFVIAERLAKQSLSDSQIQMAMEDARSKQEAFNRSRMVMTKNGHSALSIEEQKLLESLDRLNEKLKEEPSYKASNNHTQATQTQFPGFQGHRPIVDTRRHMLLSPGMIQRAQSARARQQTYLYR